MTQARLQDGSHDFVCLGVSDWGVVNSNPDYTIRGLAARGHRVLVVEPFHNLFSMVRVAAWQKRSVRWRWSLRQVEERIWVYAPPPVGLVGASRHPGAARLNARLLARLLRPRLAELGFDAPILWSFMYNAGETLRRLPGKLRIYECGDHDAALAETERQRRTVQILDEEICRAANLVFCVTEELSAPRRAFNSQTHTVNCAADVAFFSRAQDPALPVAEETGDLPRPLIGYFGGLDPWKIDVALLREIARRRPDWTIALIGYVWFGFDAEQFADARNIRILGPQAYERLPALMKGLDVGIMPFPYNDITRNGDALKCYEYLAAGLPVVSRSVPVARRLGDLVAIAEDADDFIAAIEAALAEDERAKARRRSSIAAHDWSARVDQKLELIARHV